MDLFATVAPTFEGLMARVRRAWGHRARQERAELMDEWRKTGAAGLSWLVWRVCDDADPDELHGAFDLLCAAKADAVPFVLAALEHPVKHLEGLTLLVRNPSAKGVFRAPLVSSYAYVRRSRCPDARSPPLAPMDRN